MNISPTGNKVMVTGMVFERVEDGKIVEAWVNRDQRGMMQQLGVMPEAAG